MDNKKHVLLMTSAAPSQSPFSTTEKRPPIGLGFLISVLRNAGHEVFFIDNYLQPSNFLETDYLQKNKIDYVGIYANTICYRDTLRMFYKLDYLRRTGKWSGKIMVGGPHTTVALHTIPDFVDYVVQGEGEQAILDIVEDKVKDRVVRYPTIKNLDELPMPAWDYFIHLPYKWNVDWFKETPVFTLNTSRGCPFKCTFCSVKSIWGKQYTCFSAERVVSDIEYLIKNYGAKGIYFREDNFTLNKKRLERFCNLLIEKKINIPWSCETRVNTLDRETVDLMHRAGARAFYFGVESGSQKVLDFFKKEITIEQTRNAFKLCHEFGIKTAASIIVGVPTETEDDIAQTIRLVEELKPTVTWFNVFVGIPDSELYQYAKENKLYEFIDDRGLIYLKGHNERVKRFYGNQWDAYVPLNIDKPMVSVVMSVFNGEKYLEDSVKSMLSQTYQDFEFIIINDASTDGTEEILKKFDDPRIKIIRNHENLGLTKSLNKGIKLAKGKYIARMDADDISLPQRFETQVNFLEKNPDYALVGSSYYQIDETGKINSLINVLTGDPQIKEGLKKQNWFGHGSVMMRKDALLRIGGYDERFKFSQDYDLWLKFSELYKIANIDEPLYCWRATSSCISNEKRAGQKYYADMAVSEAGERHKNKTGIKPGGDPTVSVIVPTYNRPDTLSEALDSILNQTFKEIEIVVVNDAGGDVENIVSSRNKKNNITYIRHGKNRGLAAARNTGIKVARGKYVAYLDDDDLFYPEHIETLVNFLDANKEYKVAYTDAHRANQELRNGKYIVTKRDVPYSYDFDYNLILKTNFVPVLCFMHEKECLNEVGYFDESLKRLEDWDLWIRLSRKYKLAHIKKVTCEFSWRSDGTTMTSGNASEFTDARKAVYEKHKVNLKPDVPALSKKSSAIRKGVTSIVILTFNQLKYTKECVESIRKHTSEPHEIIFVDNGSTDGTVKWLRRLVKENSNYKLIENRKNLGFAKGCNQGITAASGEYSMLLNNDVVVTDSWLSGMIECHNSSPDIGIVGPMTNNISGPQKVENADYKSTDQVDLYAKTFKERNRHRRIPMRRIVGFCMLFKRDLVDKIGLLDEGFGTGNFEDDDYCLRAALEGYRNMIAGDVFIHHYGSISFIGNRIDYGSAMGKNKDIFSKKWSGIETNSSIGKNLMALKAMEKADELNQTGQLDKAVDLLLQEGVRYSPDDRRLYFAIAEILIDARHFKDALDTINEMPGGDEDINKLVITGYCKQGMEQDDEAEQYADRALSLDPHSSLALNLKGIIAHKKGKLDAAEAFFKRAIESDNGYGEPHTNLGVMRWAAGEKKDGLDLLEKGVILSPKVTDIINLYHSAITETGEFERAEKIFRELKSFYPINKTIFFLLIDSLIKQGKSSAAMQEIESAMVAFGADDGMLGAALEIRNNLGPHETSAYASGRNSVSLCMIVKNEERHIAKCLMSLKPIVDEIIIVDTGSTDRTKGIIIAFGAKVFDFPWTGNFSDARNFSLSKASGQWIFVMDADEVISPLDHAAFIDLVKKSKPGETAYKFVTRNYITRVNIDKWNPNDGRYIKEEAGAGWSPSDKVRLFPNNDLILFENPVHELVEPSLIREKIAVLDSKIPVHHYGKLDKEKERSKGEQYFQLGKRKLNESDNNLDAICELAIQAGELGKYDEALELWEKAISINPALPVAFMNIGYIYLQKWMYAESLAASKRAMELKPDFWEAISNYSVAELCGGDIKTAISTLEGMLKRNPNYLMAAGILSAAYCCDGQRKKGLECLAELNKEQVVLSGLLGSLAKQLIAAGRLENATLLLEAAVESNNINADIPGLLTDCYLRAGSSHNTTMPTSS